MDFLRSTPVPSPSTYRRSLTASLNAEWNALVDDPGVARELAREPIAARRDLASLLAACHGRVGRGGVGEASGPADARPGVGDTSDDDAADAVLAHVVAAGLEGRTLAVRTALQRVLGGLVSVSVRRTRRQSGHQRVVLFDDLCATAWLVIAGYPLARRPRHIAANICRDTEYLTCVRPERLHDAARRVELLDEHLPSVDLRGAVRAHAADELAEVVFGLAGAVDLTETDLALLHELAVGHSTVAIAKDLGCTDRTVRNRRHRLLTTVRRHAVI
jgi:DNA-binding CsgD family transcriptional regulator